MYASVVAGIRKVRNENPESEDKSKQDIKKVCKDKNGLDSRISQTQDKISAKT